MRRRTTGDHFNRKSSHLPPSAHLILLPREMFLQFELRNQGVHLDPLLQDLQPRERWSFRTGCPHRRRPRSLEIERAPEPAVPDPLYAKAVQRREPWLFRTGCPHRRRPHPLEDSPHPPRPRGCRLSRGSPPQMDSPPPAPSCFVPVLQVTRVWGGLA